MKKALIYAPFAASEPHFETDLELTKLYLDKGYEVTVLRCKGSLPTCEPNPLHRWTPCYRCQSRFSAGIRWIGEDNVTVEDYLNLKPSEQSYIESLATLRIESLAQLKAFQVEGADIGWAALSSLISMLREPFPDVNEHQAWLKKHIIAATKVYFSIKNHLLEKKPNIFVLYNGRFSALRPALRAAQQLGIETLVHEVTATIDTYGLAINNYSLTPEVWQEDIERTYAESTLSDEEKEKIALAWFAERLNHQDQGFGIYTANQEFGKLPEHFSPTTTNIAIFNSSEDEFEAIEEFQNPIYQNQSDGLLKLLDSFGNHANIRFFLRVHPHLKGLSNTQTRFIESLKGRYRNLYIIDAESSVSTYSLVKASDLILTFGSTVGIEAVYLNKPSILLGRALYEGLEACIQPRSHEEFIDIVNTFILSGQLPKPSCSKEAVIKYGFFCKTYGHTFKYAHRHDLYHASFEQSGSRIFIKASWPARFLALLDHLIHEKMLMKKFP